jgi:hypothetical protein
MEALKIRRFASDQQEQADDRHPQSVWATSAIRRPGRIRGGGSKSATKLRHAFPCEPIFLTAPKRSSPEIGHMLAGCAVALSQYFAKARRDTAVAYGAVGVRITSVNGTQRKSRDVAVPTALGCARTRFMSLSCMTRISHSPPSAGLSNW